jgi:hypothetical protein
MSHGKGGITVRRVVGVILGISPALLLLSSLAYGLAHDVPTRLVVVAWMAVALLIGALNFYGSFIAPRRYARKHGSMAGYRHVSGMPAIGTILIVAIAIVGFGDWVCSILGSVAFAIDTGGSVWFVISTWRDESLWDA